MFQVYIAFLTYFYISLVNFQTNCKAEKMRFQIDAQKESNLTLTIFAFWCNIHGQNTLSNPRLVLFYSWTNKNKNEKSGCVSMPFIHFFYKKGIYRCYKAWILRIRRQAQDNKDGIKIDISNVRYKCVHTLWGSFLRKQHDCRNFSIEIDVKL